MRKVSEATMLGRLTARELAQRLQQLGVRLENSPRAIKERTRSVDGEIKLSSPNLVIQVGAERAYLSRVDTHEDGGMTICYFDDVDTIEDLASQAKAAAAGLIEPDQDDEDDEF